MNEEELEDCIIWNLDVKLEEQLKTQLEQKQIDHLVLNVFENDLFDLIWSLKDFFVDYHPIN